MQIAFAILITLQFLIILLHDVVEFPGRVSALSRPKQLQAVVGIRKLWTATLINACFPAIAVIFVIEFWNRPRPSYVSRYWVIYCAVTVISAIAMWYLPYFLGADEKKKAEYQAFYAGTRQILPARGSNPRPNLLHVLFHVLFVATLSLACLNTWRMH